MASNVPAPATNSVWTKSFANAGCAESASGASGPESTRGPAQPSRYGKLRREPRRDGLSTLEAAAMLMARLERDPKIEAALNTSFAKMLERYRAAQGGKRIGSGGNRG